MRRIVIMVFFIFIVMGSLPVNATMYCGRDLDGDGKATGEDETAQCIGPDGTLCPIDQATCVGAQSDPVCPEPATLNPATDKCEAAPDTECTEPYSFSELVNTCTRDISCPEGSTFNPATEACEVPTSCPAGFVYDSARGRCEKPPVCAFGTYNASRDRCEASVVPVCPAGFSYDTMRGVCVTSVTCPSGSWYNGSTDRCEKPYNVENYPFACARSRRPCDPWQELSCFSEEYGYDECYQWRARYYCDAGWNQINGGVCLDCTLLAQTTVCFVPGSCAAGSLNTATDYCEMAASYSCPAGLTYDAGTNLCYTSHQCTAGIFDPAADMCFSGVECPAGFTFSPAINTCKRDARELCSPGDVWSNDHDLCMRPDCPEGLTYESLMCRTSPSCPEGSTYHPDRDHCFGNTDKKCPFDPSKPCVDVSGQLVCSANVCFDPDSAGPAQEVIKDNDSSMLIDDGARDSSGNCLDMMYIFSGRAQSCQTSGIDSGWTNCCMTGESPFQDSMGSATTAYSAFTTIQNVFELGKIAYMTTQMLTTGYTSVSAGGNAAIASAVMAGYNAGSVTSALTSYMMATMLNPTTLIITAIVYLAQEFLLSGSCTDEDLETAMADSSGRCHEVGEYCKKEWPLAGCVQEVKIFCCFNSKLARIVHEQGRPQLKTFVPVWASGEIDDPAAANCRGFTPAEFQMLDFSRMNLSEYFNEITSQIKSNVQEKATQKINSFYNKIKK